MEIPTEAVSALAAGAVAYLGWLSFTVHRTRVVVERLATTTEDHDRRITKLEKHHERQLVSGTHA